jgi:hypothetical protein
MHTANRKEAGAAQPPAKRAAKKKTPEHTQVVSHYANAVKAGRPAQAQAQNQEATESEQEDPDDGAPPNRVARKNAKKGAQRQIPPAPISEHQAPRERKRYANQASTNAFIEQMKQEAPELAEQLTKQIEDDSQKEYTVELVCTPSSAWVPGAKCNAPDLNDFECERDIVTLLCLGAGVGEGDTFTMDPIKAVKVEGLTRKTHYFQLICTSSEALLAIMQSPDCKRFKGYTLAYFQPKDSVFGYRFQLSLKRLPAPFKDYTVMQWTKVLLSQGWDMASITHVEFATRAMPGQMAVRTMMLDIYVKPEALTSHGCGAALEHAGTDSERVSKVIDYPPAAIVLGWNPMVEAMDLMGAEQLKGQYYSDNIRERPHGEYNQMMEDEVQSYLPQEWFGKLTIRHIVKIGACKYCWGPKHERGKCSPTIPPLTLLQMTPASTVASARNAYQC